MKKLLFSLFLGLSLLLPIQINGVVGADGIVPICNTTLKNQPNSICPDVKSGATTNPVINIIKVVIRVISWVAGIAAVILIVVSGIKFASSGGDSQKVTSAKGTLINAMIGVAILILSQAIVVFVLNKVN